MTSYIAQLSPMEQKVLNIAASHLETSFSLVKSIGFQEWQKEQRPKQAEPRQAPPTQAEPRQAPPTQAEPRQAPPTQAEPRQAPPTQAPRTQAPPTQALSEPQKKKIKIKRKLLPALQPALQ